VYRLDRERNQRFGAGHVIDILLGKHNPKVDQHGHGELTVFGIGGELTDTQWRGVVRQLLAQGLLAVNGDYGVLTLTDASRAVLRKEREVRLRREPERPAKSATRTAKAAKTAPVELSAADTELFERLRAWRAGAAREQGVPAYVVFHDATLRDIAARKPATLAELSGIGGVGETKLARYGDDVLAAIAGDNRDETTAAIVIPARPRDREIQAETQRTAHGEALKTRRRTRVRFPAAPHRPLTCYRR
jgi:ATP-dependent DNA helicase RecQ